jgi:SsrA-binding protein
MMAKKKDKTPSGQIAVNRKARHDYHIEETLEVGISLTGTEVKSARAGNVNLRDGYVAAREGEFWLTDVHIAPYEQGSRENHEPRRERKLLAHRRQIAQWTAKARERGTTIVPLRMYWHRNHIKVEIALAQGKRQYDKRASIAKRESDRNIQRALKEQMH